MDRLERILDERILVLDGAFGTLLQRQALPEEQFRGERFRAHPVPLAGNGDLLALTRPDVVAGIHAAYLEAGADMVETATFNGNRISQADYRLEGAVREINLAAARIARGEADRFSTASRPRFVAGCMGPTNRTASLSPDAADPGARSVRFDDLALAYAEQAEALLEGGVDALLVETIFDTLNAKAALFAIEGVFARAGRRVPIMISVTIADRSGRTLSGQTVEAFHVSVAHARPLSIGFNCALGAREMRPFLEELSRISPFRTSAWPNAGLPNELGGYDERPEETAAHVASFARDGLVNLVGGCCGTTPETIAALARAVRGLPPRVPPPPDAVTRLAGLEPLEIRPERNFTNIGERTNVSGSRRFARLVREENYEAALEIARAQVDSGAQAVDVNLDDPLLDPERAMTRFLDLLAADPAVARVPVMIDSSRHEALLAGLKCLQGKSIVNSISLKDGEGPFLERAREIRRFGAAVVVMAFDEEGQADTADRRVAIADRAVRLLTEDAGFPPEEIVIDPNVLAVGTGIDAHRGQAVAFLEAVRRIKAAHPGVKTSGGISNLSFAFRGRDAVRSAIHAVFLRHAIEAGLDMGIVNAGDTPPLDEIPAALRELAEDLVLDRRPDATERMVAYAEANADAGAPAPPRAEAADDLPAAARLTRAIRTGSLDRLEADLAEALVATPRAIDLIEGPLMAGMSEVGDAFGAGRMFLPQVLKSARVMKRAVEILTPLLAAQKPAGTDLPPAGRVLLATVKGDVHDIGKNIVAVVLGCNGVETEDLGVMVPTDTILDEARRRGADMVGLSGLITPSLDEMVRVARAMRQRGFTLPLLVGGATTSPLHTALRIAPEYPPGVVHVRDASRAVTTVAKLLSAQSRTAFLAENARAQAAMRAEHERSRAAADLLPIAAARANAPRIDWQSEPIDPPRRPGVHRFEAIPVGELVPFINWQFFLVAWELRGPYPAILDDPAKGEEARKLIEDARGMLGRMAGSGLVRPAGIVALHPANAAGDDLEVYADEGRTEILAIFRNLRQQARRDGGAPNLCLSDFVAPRTSGRSDWLGAFVATAGDLEPFLATLGSDDYARILARTLADRLAEANAERLHRIVRTDLWGYAPDEPLGMPELFAERYRGIRPAHGYPACPDHTEKRTLLGLLGAESIGLSLTDSCMMVPVASTAGLYFASARARYFAIDRIGRDQSDDYARRKGIDPEEAARMLSRHL